MSTRSYIAMKTGENTYRAVYCHYDGYLEYNGRMLLEHYNTQERVKKLLDLGCISSLHEKLEPETGSHHCFDTPDEDVTVFYGRDRGEKGQEAFTCTEEQLKEAIPKEHWSEAHHWLIWHGRKVCHSQKPDCGNCPLSDCCDYFKANRV